MKNQSKMRKLLVVTIMMLSVSNTYAQLEPFVRSYDAVASWDDENDDWGEWHPNDITVVFNYKKTTRTAIYLEDDPIILTPISKEVKEDENSNGEKYQLMRYVDDKGNEITLLLFDMGRLILLSDDLSLLFHPMDL